MGRKIKKLFAYRDLIFQYCKKCEEIHEPNSKCIGNLKLGEMIK